MPVAHRQDELGRSVRIRRLVHGAPDREIRPCEARRPPRQCLGHGPAVQVLCHVTDVVAHAIAYRGANIGSIAVSYASAYLRADNEPDAKPNAGSTLAVPVTSADPSSNAKPNRSSNANANPSSNTSADPKSHANPVEGAHPGPDAPNATTCGAHASTNAKSVTLADTKPDASSDASAHAIAYREANTGSVAVSYASAYLRADGEPNAKPDAEPIADANASADTTNAATCRTDKCTHRSPVTKPNSEPADVQAAGCSRHLASRCLCGCRHRQV